MSEDKKSDYKKTFKTMEQNIRNFSEQIEAPLPDEKLVADFDADSYWAEVVKVCEKLSFEANKLTLSWLSPPPPSAADVVQMGACLELACVALLAALHNFPADGGRAVRTNYRDAVRAVFEACIGFVKTLSNTLGKKYPSNSHPILQNFGDISNNCENIKNLSRSNKLVCLNRLKDEHGLLKDALSELEEVNNEDFIDDFNEEAESYTEKDSQILNPSKGLIKTTIVLVKKSMDTIKKSGRDNSSEVLLEYDEVMEVLSKMSSTVDDLALTVYPPIDWTECKQANEALKEYLENCLEKLSKFHFMKSEDSIKWKEFIGKAIIHNFSEIQRVFITNGLAEMKVD